MLSILQAFNFFFTRDKGLIDCCIADGIIRESASPPTTAIRATKEPTKASSRNNHWS